MDEPALVEGWVVRARRLKARKGCDRVQVEATVAYSDNEDKPVAVTVTLKQGSRVLLRLRDTDVPFSPSKLTGIACTKAKTMAATLAVKDAVT